MLFRVLGSVDAEVDGEVRAPSGARARALLALLLLRAGDVVTVDRIVDTVWGEDPPANPDNAVQTVVGRLRRSLGPAAGAVTTRPGGYCLRLDGADLDARLFERQARAARTLAREDPAGAVALFDGALALWRGPAFAEFAETFARPAAARLAELRRAAGLDRATALLDAGSVVDAVAAAAELVDADPLAEGPVAVLMRALAAQGRTADSLDAFRRYGARLRDELGLDPPGELRELYARIVREEVGRPRPEPAPTRRTLPVRPSPILGRDAETAALLATLARPGLVTLVGTGGVGKTRIALELAHRYAHGPDPVWWVDLVPAGAGAVVGSVAAACGVELASTTDPVGSLCTALASRRGLLVLDNAEHVVDAVAALVERLRDAAPALGLLVTSRERLALDCETVQRVAPLPLPEGPDRDNPAVRLFLERASGLDEPGPAELGLVAQVCRRLDGLPLAIELGAARAGGLGLDVLADRLDDRLDVLGGGRRTAHQRHRTLRAVVGWSHDLLDAREAALFRRLAVFPAAFTLDQAEAVCTVDVPPRVVGGLLAGLVDRSLVQTVRDGRLRLLETLRAFAAERLAEAGETAALVARHAADTADRLTAGVAALWGPGEGAAVEALTALTPDLHAAWAHARRDDRALALRMAGEVYDFAYFRQRLDLLRWGLAVVDWPVGGPAAAPALGTAAAALWSAGRLAEAAEVAERGIAEAGGPDSEDGALAVEVSADIAMFFGRTELAVERYRRHAELRRRRGQPVHAALAELAVAHTLLNAGRTAEAADVLARTVPEALRHATPTAATWAHYLAGEVAAPDDPARAAELYHRAITCGLRADSRLFVTMTRTSAAALSARTGALDEALAGFPVALDEWVGLGNLSAAWWVVQHMVALLARAGRPEDAAVLAGAVEARRDAIPLFSVDLSEMHAATAAVRERLGPDAADAAHVRGAALSDADVLALARAAPDAAARDLGAEKTGTGPPV